MSLDETLGNLPPVDRREVSLTPSPTDSLHQYLGSELFSKTRDGLMQFYREWDQHKSDRVVPCAYLNVALLLDEAKSFGAGVTFEWDELRDGLKAAGKTVDEEDDIFWNRRRRSETLGVGRVFSQVRDLDQVRRSFTVEHMRKLSPFGPVVVNHLVDQVAQAPRARHPVHSLLEKAKQKQRELKLAEEEANKEGGGDHGESDEPDKPPNAEEQLKLRSIISVHQLVAKHSLDALEDLKKIELVPSDELELLNEGYLAMVTCTGLWKSALEPYIEKDLKEQKYEAYGK